ncbi:hypothetical protein V6N13_047032 [Hibiscus sabdariffa]|uniref:Uncharacterized protein n=1 Tax=Hibiscus sabdariffa TaxID=183260 RepID=A0ABR1Z6F4_9ROSI
MEWTTLQHLDLRREDQLDIDMIRKNALYASISFEYREFGGLDHGDDQAALLLPGNKPLTQIVQDDSFREFEFRQYLFACQSKDDPLYVKVNKLSPTKTQLPYDYYFLNYCKQPKILNSAKNLGEVLHGDRMENSVYTMSICDLLGCYLLVVNDNGI